MRERTQASLSPKARCVTSMKRQWVQVPTPGFKSEPEVCNFTLKLLLFFSSLLYKETRFSDNLMMSQSWVKDTWELSLIFAAACESKTISK